MNMFIYLMVLDTEEEKIKFVKIYDAYKDRMHYTASVILKDKLNAEDMVHDTFLTLTDYLDRIDEEDFTGTWNYIATILKNKCYNFIKKSKKIELIADDIIFEQSVEGYNLLESQLIKEESEEFLNSLIRGLKYPYKEVIYLQYYNKLNSRQIAEILETIQSCERTVKERYVEKRIHL